MTPNSLAEYVTVMRDLGVSAFEADGIKITLGPRPAPPLRPRDPDAPPAPRLKSDYERLLFAATEGISEDDQ